MKTNADMADFIKSKPDVKFVVMYLLAELEEIRTIASSFGSRAGLVETSNGSLAEAAEAFVRCELDVVFVPLQLAATGVNFTPTRGDVTAQIIFSKAASDHQSPANLPMFEQARARIRRHDAVKPPINAWTFLGDLHKACHFQTKEGKKVGRASNSELKRWIQNKALLVNGETVEWNEPLDFPIISVVLFPKSGRVTLA